MKVTWMGERTVVVCITCSKRRETMLQLCKVLESLNLNIVTTNFSSFSSRLSTTLFLQVTFSIDLFYFYIFKCVVNLLHFVLISTNVVKHISLFEVKVWTLYNGITFFLNVLFWFILLFFSDRIKLYYLRFKNIIFLVFFTHIKKTH